MSINKATPKEWDNLFRGPDKREECLMTEQKSKTLTGSLYHPSDSSLDKIINDNKFIESYYLAKLKSFNPNIFNLSLLELREG